MRRKLVCVFAIFIVIVLVCGCSEKSAEEIVIQLYPLDSIDDVITGSGVALDTEITSDGTGALKITADEPVVVRLFETGDIDVENARLLYRAKLRTENVDGRVYLEMYCHVPGAGEAFSRGLQSPLAGTNEWVTEEIPFFLQEGQNPDNVKLNLVVDGTGTAWIDDIMLLKAPLQ
jgi:hypothetical protein